MRPALLALSCLLAASCQEYDLSIAEAVDVFFQDPAPEVDVLLVIDNSGSMQAYQYFVGARFNEFIRWFDETGIDYHIAVTTTTLVKPAPSPSQDCPQEAIDAYPDVGYLHHGMVITPDTPEAGDAFADIVKVGICGSGYEAGLEAARAVLAPEQIAPGGANAHFLRESANLSVVFVSDEQDGSIEPVAHYVNDFYNVKGGRRRDVFNASALVITDATDCIIPIAGSSEGSRYVAVAETTGGIKSNLCNTNFAEAMAEISFASSRMKDTFFLTQSPNPATLDVSVGNRVVGCDEGEWTYQLVDHLDTQVPAIVFTRDELPRPDSEIVVRYDLGDGDPADACPEPVEVE